MCLDNKYTIERCPVRDPKEAITKKESEGEVIFYFQPKYLQPDVAEILGVINGLFYNGNCSGGDATRVKSGEIRVFFNPMIHCSHDHKIAIEQITKAISSCNSKNNSLMAP